MKKFNLRISTVLFLMSVALIGKDSFPDNAIPGEIILKLSPDTEQIMRPQISTGITTVDYVLSEFGLSSIEPVFPTHERRTDLPDVSRIYKVKYNSEASPLTVARAVSGLPKVLYAEPNTVHEQFETPNDPMYSDQWHLPKISAHLAWNVSHGNSEILIGIVDSGVDMDHPDLADNLWYNEPEMNGTEGVDDDGNGFVDDVWGWDFAFGDNNPDNIGAGNAHGSHVAGLSNAVTDNNVGVAGVAWNIRTIVTKHSDDQAASWIANGMEGIMYAAEMGASVINCSWGGGGYSQYGQDVIDYVTGLGALVVAAAGNSNSDDVHFPAAYEEVMSVAATGSNDNRASFSNYGIWVDVAAPGVSTLATVPEHSYANFSGTSMASPITAGVAGLVKSFFPDLTPQELAMRVAGSTTNIDGFNPGYEGLLGSGRVNAYQGLTYNESDFVEIPPRIALVNASVSDSVGGDGNGLFDRGETVHVSTFYRNYSLGSADEYFVTLTTIDSDLTVEISETGVSPFPSDTSHTILNGLSFSIAEDADPHMGWFALTVNVEGEVFASDTISVVIGKMPVLIVDDDEGTRNADLFYSGILDEMNVLYGKWDHIGSGSPSREALSNFPIVVWLCEWAFPSLDANDRDALRDYMDNGGNLYISGQDLGWDLNENPGDEDQTTFFTDYLHAQWGGDHAGTDWVEGVHGDPIGDGLSFNVYQPELPSSNQYPDWFTPDEESHLIFHYDNGLGFGLRYEGDYRLVYTGMGLEAMGSDMYSTAPEDINNYQRTALTRILGYLNFIHHDPLMDTENFASDFEINAQITGDTSDLENVILYYKTGTMTDFAEVAMSDEGDGNFLGNIPAAESATNVDYYIGTVNSYYSWTNPVGAPENTFSFYAGADTVLPEINFVTLLEDRIDRSGSEVVEAVVSDNTGVGSVALNYSLSSDTNAVIYNVPMTSENNLWSGEILWEDQPGNTVISYYVEATDASTGQNISMSEVLSFKIVNYARVTSWEELDDSGWDTGGGWGVVFINNDVGYGMNDSPGGTYENNANNILTKLEPFDLSPYESAFISFWNACLFEEDKDFGYVELTTDGVDWTTVSTITGVGTMRDEIIDVTDFINDSDLRIRFRMTSDEQNTFVGWYVDDLYLLVDTTFDVSAMEPPAQLPEKFALHQNYPNPFNPTTTISFTVTGVEASASRRTSLQIYDITGRLVGTLVDALLQPGTHSVLWDASQHTSGVYFYRLESGIFSETKKLILLK